MFMCDLIANVLMNMILIMILIIENKRRVATVAYLVPEPFRLVDMAFVGVVIPLDAVQITNWSLRHSRGLLLGNRESCGPSSRVTSKTALEKPDCWLSPKQMNGSLPPTGDLMSFLLPTKFFLASGTVKFDK